MVLNQAEINKVLAEEYGFLDHKYKMGYFPRPLGYENSYKKGWRDFSNFTERKEITDTSYRHKENWGWY